MFLQMLQRDPLNSRPAHVHAKRIGPGRHQTWTTFAIAAISALFLSLSAHPGHAQEGAFAGLPGSWSGGGTIALANGSREHIRCRANYSVRGGGSELGLTLRCASDSYNFSFSGNARSRGSTVTGNWNETNQGVSGRFTGQARDGHISARVEGENFTASLGISTSGDRQSISIRSPGSEFSEVMVALRRR